MDGAREPCISTENGCGQISVMNNSEYPREVWAMDSIVQHACLVDRSYRRWMGRGLLEGMGGEQKQLSHALFFAPFVLVSHGTELDPILNFGNAAALRLWEVTWEELRRMPSRETAEAPDRDERARLLDRVTKHGFIDDYSGVRISKSGKRFQITRATVWNLVTEHGDPAGQAAMFSQWTPLG